VLTKSRYSIADLALWTRVETLIFIAYAAVITGFFSLAGLHFLHVPWAPVAVIGTAVAFIVGFQNNAAYGRIWEARKIWGGIVNASRAFAMKTKDMVSESGNDGNVTDEELCKHQKVIVHRHIAWLTALRHAMRTPKKWEEFRLSRTNREWARQIHIPERVFNLDDELLNYLSEDELEALERRGNKATAILGFQSSHLRELREQGILWEFAFLELENVLHELFSLQGKSERIKNFPYPRQYASLSFYFVRVFVVLLPFAAVPEFNKIGLTLVEDWPQLAPHFIWVAVPFCSVISWVFHTMERIGRVGENPFEGSVNDVPVSTIARGIEIDICQMIDEDPDHIPKPIPEVFNVQM
jgi:putative membrane protein